MTEAASPSPLDPLAELEGDGWLDLVRAAEAPQSAGSIGSYAILSAVRGGGQGLVFRARQPSTGRDVALKRMASGSLSSAVERRRFQREVDALLDLDHPNVVTVHGVEDVDGVPVLAMEWVDGASLTEWAGTVPRDRAGLRARMEVFAGVCEAVAHAHQRGIFHRDLKPSNILVDERGRPRVVDFGLARRVPAGDYDSLDPTVTSGFSGTPAYSAPECFVVVGAAVDARSDVFSLGVVLYELLTGMRPFQADGIKRLIGEIEEREPPPPSKVCGPIDRDLDAIVSMAMAKVPERRYQTVNALLDDVHRWQAGMPLLATPPSTASTLRKWVCRNRLIATLLACIAVSAAGAVGTGAWNARVLASERDQARIASQRADTARAEAVAAQRAADRERSAAEEARRLAIAAGIAAETADGQAQAVGDFYLHSILQAATPYSAVGSRRLDDVLVYATEHMPDWLMEHRAAAIEVSAHLARAFARMNRPGDAVALLNACDQTLLGVDAQGAAALEPLLWQARCDVAIAEGRYGDAEAALHRADAALRRAVDDDWNHRRRRQIQEALDDVRARAHRGAENGGP